MQALQTKYGDKVEFIIADVQQPEGQELARDYGVMSIPALFIIDAKGQEVYNRVGYTQEQVLSNLLAGIVPK